MINSPIKITRVAKADIDKLQTLSRKTFIEAFSSANTPEDMESYTKIAFAKNQLEKEISNPESEFYFAMLEEKAIGYLKINYGKAQSELSNTNSLEIERIYVTGDHQGQKIGQMLFEKACTITRNKGFDYIWLGVWDKNTRAIHFYQKNGFIRFDTHTFKLGNDIQTDIMMKLKV